MKFFSSRFYSMMGAFCIAAVSLFGSARAEGANPEWWFGAAAAANLNFYGGTTQRLNGITTTPVPFHDGFGIAPYGALALEYRPQGPWGAALQAGYDARWGAWDKVECPCGEDATLSARPAYLSLEPSLIWTPFEDRLPLLGTLHLFAGPRLALRAPFGNPREFRLERDGLPENRGDFDHFRNIVVSGQVGIGTDLELASGGNRRWRLAPFVSWHPWIGQSPRATDADVETWRLSTVRVGLVLKFARAAGAAPEIRLSARAPARVVTRRTIHETFPLRDYVFFDDTATDFASRYVRLSPEEAAAFREEQLQDSLPSEPKGRSRRQMIVYRNILNVLGDRLRRNPQATVTLTGLSAQGADKAGADLAVARAEAVKRYLVSSFGLAPERLSIDVKAPPPPPLGRPREDLERLEAEARRVEIGSRSPEMLVQVGEGFMLKPVKIQGEQEASDSVFLRLAGFDRVVSWRLEIADEEGRVQTFGPFDAGTAPAGRMTVSGSRLLGARNRGAFHATVIAEPSAGSSAPVRAQASFGLFRRNNGVEETRRYAILFDIDEARAVSAYEKFLNETVTEKIGDTSLVMIRGRTDVVGDAEYNLKLSRNRAEGVRSLLENAAAREGRRGVRFKPSWSGEDPAQSPFGNATPEERNYNRTVIIDILPE